MLWKYLSTIAYLNFSYNIFFHLGSQSKFQTVCYHRMFFLQQFTSYKDMYCLFSILFVSVIICIVLINLPKNALLKIVYLYISCLRWVCLNLDKSSTYCTYDIPICLFSPSVPTLLFFPLRSHHISPVLRLDTNLCRL